MKRRVLPAVVFLAAVAASAATPDDRTEYNRRAANADVAAYRQLDLNRDGRVTEDEARADLNFFPRFRDIDINRDGVITPEEMRGYIQRAYGIQTSS